MRRRQKLALLAVLLSCVSAFVAALGLVGQVRLVDVLTVFASGFGAGAGLVAAVRDARGTRRSPSGVASPTVP